MKLKRFKHMNMLIIQPAAMFFVFTQMHAADLGAGFSACEKIVGADKGCLATKGGKR